MSQNIEKTSDYEIFKIIDGNRNIDSKHVKNLINSIKKENLLQLRPILIDENYYVLDGQHRLEAAKSLGVPIFFYKIQSVNHREIITLNQNNKNWKILDFLNYHAFKTKSEIYLKIIQIMNSYGWNIQEFFIYSSFPIKKIKSRKNFEDGLFVFEVSDEQLNDFYSKWNTFKEFVESKNLEHADAVNSLTFKEAFLFFHKSTQIKLNQFWEKLRSNPTYFHRCMNKDQYLDMFLKIYNYSMVYKIEKGML